MHESGRNIKIASRDSGCTTGSSITLLAKEKEKGGVGSFDDQVLRRGEGKGE